jgi:hypothetical protein
LFLPTPLPTWIPGRIVINEVLIRPHYDWEGTGGVDSNDEFIELHNLGPFPVFLRGFVLDPRRLSPRRCNDPSATSFPDTALPDDDHSLNMTLAALDDKAKGSIFRVAYTLSWQTAPVATDGRSGTRVLGLLGPASYTIGGKVRPWDHGPLPAVGAAHPLHPTAGDLPLAPHSGPGWTCCHN